MIYLVIADNMISAYDGEKEAVRVAKVIGAVVCEIPVKWDFRTM